MEAKIVTRFRLSITKRQALTVKCPRCKVKPGQKCWAFSKAGKASIRKTLHFQRYEEYARLHAKKLERVSYKSGEMK